MHRRLASNLVTSNLVIALSLVALATAGCGRSGDSSAEKKASGEKTIAEIWAAVLTQRDQMHIAFMKPLEDVTHQDCADVGNAARRMDELISDLVNLVGAQSGADAGRLRSLGDVVARATAVNQQVRETALNEAPGGWEALRFPVDVSLRQIETFFTPEALGGESVLMRPGFETSPMAQPPSPI